MTAASHILQAIEALKQGDRLEAFRLLTAELRDGPPTGERWRSISQLASKVGEIDIAVEAARRFALTPPIQLDRLLFYWGELTSVGRSAVALGQVRQLSARDRNRNGVLHFLGTVAVQEGDFDRGIRLFRQALAQPPQAAHTWFALSMAKTFKSGADPDIAAMEKLATQLPDADPLTKSRFLYGLAKAWHDCGEPGRAMAHYQRGAALRRRATPFDLESMGRLAESLIRDFSSTGLARLAPPRQSENRAIFVNGLPRSGTTLVEQILASHSAVSDGAEINLLKNALLPTLDHSLAGALAYQDRLGAGADPWGAVNQDYHRMLAMRFGSEGRVVDKTLLQSHFMGLLLHALPDARIIWMRRGAEDSALSCFRTYFTAPVDWSWDLADIGRMFAIEDRLFEHWQGVFGERILAVPYEELAAKPTEWIPRLLAHAGLEEEPQVYEPHKQQRSVRTASVTQVRAPITSKSVGYSGAYAEYLEPFRAAYGK